MEKNYLITLTGPSGVGKSYLKARLKKFFGLGEIVVYTTRKPRKKDCDDKRIFLTDQNFLKKMQNNELVFIKKLFGFYYAFSKEDLEQFKEHKSNLITELYVDNVYEFKKIFPSSDTIAIVPESIKFLEYRLQKRLENEASISVRLLNAKEEINNIFNNSNLFNLIYVVGSINENKVLEDIIRHIER